MNLVQNNYFHINTPYYGAWTKYGWGRDDWGLGLNKERIDKLDDGETIYVSYGKKDTLYTIKAGKVKKYPVEKLRWGGVKVYIIPKSVLNYKGLLQNEELKEEARLGIYG